MICVCQVHLQTECQPVDGAASDSDTNDVNDSSDMLHYVSNSSSSQLAAGESQLITGTAEPVSSSSSSYKVFVSGNSGEYFGKAVKILRKFVLNFNRILRF